MKKLTLATVLTFGKHNGKTISYVVENDPSYILWLDENTDCIVSNTVYESAKSGMQGDLYDGYETNLHGY